MRKLTFLLSIFSIYIMISCGGNGNKGMNGGLADGATGNIDDYESSSVNAIVQAKPEIMVIPSDGNLKNFGKIKETKINGETYIIRDYTKYLLDEPNFKGITAHIQQSFVDMDFPLNDFEQALKNLETQKANDLADNLSQDSKTKLLATTHPDIVLELDYTSKTDFTKSNGERSGKYIVNAVDPYTNKVVASISADNLKGNNEVNIINEGLDKNMPKLMADIQKYFNDILTRGREVTVRINVDSNSNQKLTDENIEGETYSDAIVDYIKTHTVKGAYKLQNNTSDELTFTNVRIKLLNEDGTQYGVYDWTRDLQKHLRKNLGLSSENRSQGLGEIVLTVKGI